MAETIDRILRQLDIAQDEAFWQGDVEKFISLGTTIREVEREGYYDRRD